jgi:hypothetical protein
MHQCWTCGVQMANQHKMALSEFRALYGEEASMPEQMDSDVYVRVDWADRSQPQTMWQYDKFMNRLYIMREMYQTWSEHNHSLANTDFADPERDPFFDPPEDQLVGEHANSSGVTLHKAAATPLCCRKIHYIPRLTLSPLVGGRVHPDYRL